MCLPEAWIADISDRLEACMTDEGIRPIVCLSVRGNDVGRICSEELFRRFREALGKVRDRGGVPVVYWVLLKRAVGRWH